MGPKRLLGHNNLAMRKDNVAGDRLERSQKSVLIIINPHVLKAATLVRLKRMIIESYLFLG